MNVIQLTGRLVKDKSQLKSTASNGGKKKLTISIAVDREMSNPRKADFFNIVLWDKKAEFVEKWYRKGAMVEVSGSLCTDNYNDSATGAPKSFTYVNANNFNFTPTNQGVFTPGGQAQDSDPSGDVYQVPDDGTIIYD